MATAMTFPCPLNGKQLATLARRRTAWRHAVLTLRRLHAQTSTWPQWGESTPVTPGHLEEAIDALADTAGMSDAGTRAAAAYRALDVFPMPPFEDERFEDGVWNLFFQLVLAVQAERLLYVRFFSSMLALVVEDDQRPTDWWLTRARAYAPLGLPIATRL